MVFIPTKVSFFTINHTTFIVNRIPLPESIFDFDFMTKIWILTIFICVVNSIIENFELYLRHKLPSDSSTQVCLCIKIVYQKKKNILTRRQSILNYVGSTESPPDLGRWQLTRTVVRIFSSLFTTEIEQVHQKQNLD